MDMCKEIRRLAYDCDIIHVSQCKGLKEDFASVSHEFDNGRTISIEGPVSWVLSVLRTAHGII